MSAHAPLVKRLIVVVFAMFGFGFALVPLYEVFCDITGINGKTDNVASQAATEQDLSRKVTVEFISYVPNQLAWQFEPKVKRVEVYPGESMQIEFIAANQSRAVGTVQAVPSVSPGPAATHLKKVSCFCFEQQTLSPGEHQDMPLLFYLDPDLPAHISTVTLAYTLFDVTPETTLKASVDTTEDGAKL
ncbi:MULTISPECIES: cytochrome c oxidase assembly protein [Aliagarivorans]|uniref:cytochrome c oxidase assembly protein n=1 Tax=Aliagarivorans TaxID=882379 RepID=UPI00040CDDCD|nr:MULTISPECIES: cytochrome c oxidase assembly protein [Aliagarivorans]